ncbi:EAL domain-containing protein (plasmid) [Pseudomonas luteola]|uniref:bifunctional diguanylate cyclase/phosphodiesterase n=1 Tax=Pseudomonas luteola TaxID=47886 RepID=UPI003DA0FA02
MALMSQPSADNELKNNYSQLMRRSGFGFSLLLVLLFLITATVLVYVAVDQNRHQIQHSQVDALKAIETRQNKIGTALTDYAFWSDAYKYTLDHISLDWAYDRDNIGPSLFSTYGLDGIFILGPDFQTRYALIKGEQSSTTASSWIKGNLNKLIERAREKSPEDGYAFGYFNVGGTPAVVYTAIIRPDSSYTNFDKLSSLVFVNILTPAKLKVIGKDFDLHELKVGFAKEMPAVAPFIQLSSDPGVQIRLGWQAEYPGDKFLYTLLPLLLVLGLVFIFLVRSLQSKAMVAARLIDASQASLATSEERFRTVSEASSDWIWETNAQYEITFLSDRFISATGFSKDQWLSRPLHELLAFDIEEFEALALSIEGRICSRKPIDSLLVNQEGHTRFCSLTVRTIMSGHEPTGYRGTVCDVTDETEAKAQLKHLSQHDALTGLANRTRMYSFLQSRLGIEHASDSPVVILSLDLDRFKPVNDTLGHMAGDRVLNEVAQRLAACVRHDDLVARLGGDEFVVVACDLPDLPSIEQLCERILDSLGKTISIGEHEVSIGASIGVALSPRDGNQAVELLRYADIALYEAKAAGRNNWQFYADEMNARILERRQIETDLRQALRRNEFYLEFQPRIQLSGPSLAGAEALVRWRHPERGLLSPAHFISIAEETGLIVQLSDWVMQQACKEAMHWNEELIVSVNLSPVEFQRGDLLSRVRDVLHLTGITPGRLELEVTEGVMLEDAEGALDIMRKLKGLGVRLSMDDFGTGYSSLSYLLTYPFDGLKIDRSFIAGLDENTCSQAIIHSIVDLGRAMSLTVTAEGIETQAQLDELVRVNCDQAQGYHLGRPMSAEALREIMKVSRVGTESEFCL